MRYIILANYGGPEREEELRPYLYRLFSDRNVIRLPGGKIMQRIFASVVSGIRSKSVLEKYKRIGFSPLNGLTRQLVEKMNKNRKDRYMAGMAYCEPFISTVIDSIEAEEVYILPLFPHFSGTTTKTCLDQAQDRGKDIFYIHDFWENRVLNDHIINKIRSQLNSAQKTAVVLSAHSIPLKYDTQGDPYLGQVNRHFELLKKRLESDDIFLGFQSKIGPVEWAKPAIDELLKEIKDSGYRRVVVYPLSFLIDNFEIRYDLDLEYRTLSEKSLEMEYTLIDCFNDSDETVNILDSIIGEAKWLKLG